MDAVINIIMKSIVKSIIYLSFDTDMIWYFDMVYTPIPSIYYNTLNGSRV